ncbi:hypothetical protein HYFRA_00005948 [Hymenoscyphus fraxineus]|uniref:Zn(2)-C6 fungal-type domain-containing protein n=1 Tax=Hymenoscyphus fraxineus TaxID=746836 RepID=A0A9N9KU60_9HELO|nr:hypothetical protein HYFRA_00005948 [Hymenoscyphus fraxineus]
MTFPSKGCRTCKQRRVKCDETRPTCNRCQKAKIVCQRPEEDSKYIFLSENEYAVSERKRPRGPNVNTPSNFTSTKWQELSNTPDYASIQVMKRRSPEISPPLQVSLADQALTYYSNFWVEAPRYLPEIAESHLKYITPIVCYSQPDSILSLAISAVSHATFSRARKLHDALAVASKKYSKALLNMNLALTNATEAKHDDVIIAIMLLSFYENCVVDKNSQAASSEGIQVTGARSFAHHDGAMAVLKLRRRQDNCTKPSSDVDKLVRRQLIRSLLLRSLPIPAWLRNGEEYGESGFALALDKYMVEAAELRYQSSTQYSSELSKPGSGSEQVRLHGLLERAQNLDFALMIWAGNLPIEYSYSNRTVQVSEHVQTDEKIFDETVHIYQTVAHAAIWNRYRAIRLTVNDIILKTITSITWSFGLAIDQADTKSVIQFLTDDMCASIPYMLKLIDIHETTATPRPTSEISVKATTAFLLAWPLAMTTMLSRIPGRHLRYLKSRLLDVSEIANDGVLERVAVGL